MLLAPIPDNETERLAALQRYCVLDTLPEPAFDRLTHILQYVLGVPTVLVSLVDSDRQWFKSRIGLDATETPRNISFCGHAVFHRKMLIVPDAREDARFADNPLVVGAPGLRFYAGTPLITSDGFALGTICAIDYVPRPAPNEAQIDVMTKLADAVVAALELRASEQAQAARARLSQVLGQIADAAHHAVDMADALRPVLAELCTYIGAAVGHVYLRIEGQAETFASSGVWHFADPAHQCSFVAFRAATQELAANAEDGLYQQVDSDGEPLFIADLAAQEAWPRARLASAAGLQSLLAFAIPVGSQAYGIVECYGERRATPEPDHFTVARYVGVQLGRLAERERVERLKNEFVSTVSHELRTPLTSIAGALELLDAGVAGPLPASAKEMVGIAHNNSRRLIRLVNDILDIEKIESGRMPFNLQWQALTPLVERAVAETSAFAKSLGVGLEFSPPAANFAALIDADRFIQVMTNLLSNAAKFSPRDAAVTVTLANASHCDGWLRVSVADCGPGIPEAFRGRIFEKFAQADNADNRQRAGTGLGLAIARNIVERMRGSVSFETELGRGTVFHVDLPLADNHRSDREMK